MTSKTVEKTNRVLAGEVISSVQDKTIVVKVVRTFKHPLLGKIIRRSKNYQAHDETNSANIGDLVEIIVCSPYSKTKSMKLQRITRSAQ